MAKLAEAIRRDIDVLNFTPNTNTLSRAEIERQVRAEGYTDPDIIEFEIEDRLGMLKYEPFENL
ncbi:MAG: hypothetical protein HC836_16615 [Richelia sp. RM2_1_2]|nr:hypothetical protein [Richelia sp. RM2_1_2]